jgi:hypothetical protein
MEFYSPPGGGSSGGGLKTSGVGYDTLPAMPAAPTSVTPGTSNGWGSWVQFRAAAGNAIYVVGAFISTRFSVAPTTLIGLAVQIGIGGAGAESAIGTIDVPPNPGGSVNTSGQVVFFPFPIPVAASTRVAARASYSTTTAPTVGITLMVLEQSNLVAI